MKKHVQGSTRARRATGVLRRVWFMIGTLLLIVRDALADDLILLWKNSRLFVGIALLGVGLLSFTSDRYCDGNQSSYYACTRPSTYYFYPWWATALVLAGSFFIILWFLRRQKRR